jgi:hypothetical protein
MGDLNKVIDFRARANDRVGGRTPVDSRVCADFDVVLNNDPPQLRDLEVSVIAAEGETKSILTDTNTGVNDHPVTDDETGKGNTWAYTAVIAEKHARPDHSVGADVAPSANFRGSADDRAGFQTASGTKGCGLVDHGGLSYQRFPFRCRIKGRGDTGEAVVWVFGHKQCHSWRCLGRMVRMDKAGARLASGKTVSVTQVIEKTDVLWTVNTASGSPSPPILAAATSASTFKSNGPATLKKRGSAIA